MTLAAPWALAQEDGFYIGATAGYAWGTAGHNSQVIPVPDEEPVPDDGRYRIDGLLAGATIGYNMWFARMLVGAEADYALAWIDGDGVCTVSACRGEVRSFGTVRGRFGYDMGGWTVYATAGLALADFQALSATPPGYRGSRLRAGWTAGLGFERPITQALSWKLEYS